MRSRTASSATEPRSEPVDHAAILDWLDSVRAGLRAAPFADLLELDGLNVLDVLFKQLYLSMLKALRNRVAPSPDRALGPRMHVWAYHQKMAWRQRLAARRTKPVRPADFVLWPRENTHAAILLPVAHALRQRGASCELLACQTAMFNRLRGQEVEAVYTGGAWPQVVRKARKDGISRAAQLTAGGRWPVPPFENASIDSLEQVVRHTVISQLPHVSESIANARAALDRFGCRVLVVGNDLTMEGRAGCRVAAARGIPSAAFMHGNISASPVHAYQAADRLLAFGESQRRDLLRLGIADERIVVCGAPSLDRRPRQTARIHPLAQSQLGLKSGEPWILVATSGPGHRISHAHHEKIVANLVRLSTALPDVPLVIKLHHKDRLENYREGLKDYAGQKIFVVPYEKPGFPTNIFDWLQGCSMVLTGMSSVAMEAMLMDVPVITMDYCDEIHGADFIDAGATLHVRTGEALEAAVRTILAGGAPGNLCQRVQAYLKDAYFALDGGSASRGAAALCELAENGKPR
jgi:UDP-N-acetylglucosamine 2-epimerase